MISRLRSVRRYRRPWLQRRYHHDRRKPSYPRPLCLPLTLMVRLPIRAGLSRLMGKPEPKSQPMALVVVPQADKVAPRWTWLENLSRDCALDFCLSRHKMYKNDILVSMTRSNTMRKTAILKMLFRLWPKILQLKRILTIADPTGFLNFRRYEWKGLSLSGSEDLSSFGVIVCFGRNN